MKDEVSVTTNRIQLRVTVYLNWASGLIKAIPNSERFQNSC